MRVLVIGSRSWTDVETIKDRLRRLPRGTEIISGGARGADRLAATIARGMGFHVVEMPAFWREHGEFNANAGRERNVRMLERGPALVLAFWDGQSTGTKHTLYEAHKRGIEWEVVSPRRRAGGDPIRAMKLAEREADVLLDQLKMET